MNRQGASTRKFESDNNYSDVYPRRNGPLDRNNHDPKVITVSMTRLLIDLAAKALLDSTLEVLLDLIIKGNTRLNISEDILTFVTVPAS